MKDFKETDPIPDIFNRYSIGDVVKTSDGRRWRRIEDYEWEEITND